MRNLLFLLIFATCAEPFKLDSTSLFENEIMDAPRQENAESVNVCFYNPETMPAYPGGMIAFYDFFNKDFRWPEPSLCIEGKIFVQFIVELDGSVSEIKVVKGIEKAYDDEVLKVISIMPNWRPGALYGHPTRMKMMMPITFR